MIKFIIIHNHNMIMDNHNTITINDSNIIIQISVIYNVYNRLPQAWP